MPLLRWDGLHLVLDLPALERLGERWLGGVDELSDLRLTGEGDALRVAATVTWRGIPSRVAVDLAEIRLKDRYLGLRFLRPRVLGGLPVPRAVLERVLGRLSASGVAVVRGQGIVVVDLRRWIAPELEVRLLTVQATSRALHVWLGPGLLSRLPGAEPRSLPATASGPRSS